MMRILSAEISNFRVIAHAKIDVNGEPFLIHGPNMTGKSTAGEAIVWALCDLFPADTRVTKEMIRPSLPIADAQAGQDNGKPTSKKTKTNLIGDTVVEVRIACPIFEGTQLVGEERITVRRSLQGAALKMNFEITLEGGDTYRSEMAQSMIYARAGIRHTERESEAQKAFLRMVWLGVGQEETFFKAKPTRKREILEMSNPVTVLDKAFREAQNMISQRQKDRDQKSLDEAKFRGMFESKVSDLAAFLQQDDETLQLLSAGEDTTRRDFIDVLQSRGCKIPTEESEIIEMMSLEVDFFGVVEERVASQTIASKATDKSPDVLRADIKHTRDESALRLTSLNVLDSQLEAKEKLNVAVSDFSTHGGDEALEVAIAEGERGDASADYFNRLRAVIAEARAHSRGGQSTEAGIKLRTHAAREELAAARQKALNDKVYQEQCLTIAQNLCMILPNLDKAGIKIPRLHSLIQAQDGIASTMVIIVSKLSEAGMEGMTDASVSHLLDLATAFSLHQPNLLSTLMEWECYLQDTTTMRIEKETIREKLRRDEAEIALTLRTARDNKTKLLAMTLKESEEPDALCDHCGNRLTVEALQSHQANYDAEINRLMATQVDLANQMEAITIELNQCKAEETLAGSKIDSFAKGNVAIASAFATAYAWLIAVDAVGIDAEENKIMTSLQTLERELAVHQEQEKVAKLALEQAISEASNALGMPAPEAESSDQAIFFVEQSQKTAMEWSEYAKEQRVVERFLVGLKNSVIATSQALTSIESKMPPSLKMKNRREIEAEIETLAQKLDVLESLLQQAERIKRIQSALDAVVMNRNQWTLLRSALDLMDRELVSLGKVKTLLSPAGAARDYLIARDRDFVETQANHYIRLFDPAIVPVVKLSSSEDSGKSALDINVEVSGAVMPKLSNSQRGLVEICLEVAMRELSQRPDFLFIDEPENGFDSQNKPKLEAFLHKITKQPIYITNAQSTSFNRSVSTSSYQSFLRGFIPPALLVK